MWLKRLGLNPPSVLIPKLGGFAVNEAPEEVANAPFEEMERRLEMPAEPLLPLTFSPTRRLR